MHCSISGRQWLGITIIVTSGRCYGKKLEETEAKDDGGKIDNTVGQFILVV